ncbi:MAG: hypothetical protein NTV08_13585 [Verrucomicrobia bacterium]|nr:hypothetical protein [Verrucomicrobiota bacterium]
MSKWTPWCDTETAKSPDGPLNIFGIYRIRMVNSTGEKMKIDRVCKVDSEGFIYFGRSGFQSQNTKRTIANRVREFLQKKHSGGIAYARIKPLLDRHLRFADHHLEIQGQRLPDAHIETAEAKLLGEYLKEFGELPPCNSSLPKVAAAQDV